MEAVSPVFAALGVSGYDALNDLAHWLDGGVEPTKAETSGWIRSWGDQVRAAVNPAGREG
jgi:hypothetical protein